MRFFAPVFALFTAVAVAQSQFNVIDNGSGGLSPSAGQNTLTWTNPSSGTVTIKLQVDDPAAITPNSGIILAQNVPASAKSATVTIPANEVAPNVRYVYQIIDNTNSNTRDNANFSFGFMVTGATGSTSTMTTMTSTGSSTMTGSTSTRTSSGTSSETTTTSGSSTMTGTSSTRTSTMASSTTTRTSTSVSGTATPTTAPGSAGRLAAHGGLVALMMGAVAVM